MKHLPQGEGGAAESPVSPTARWRRSKSLWTAGSLWSGTAWLLWSVRRPGHSKSACRLLQNIWAGYLEFEFRAAQGRTHPPAGQGSSARAGGSLSGGRASRSAVAYSCPNPDGGPYCSCRLTGGGGAAGLVVRARRPVLAGGETAIILLYYPLPAAGGSIAMERGRQQNGRTLAGGHRPGRRRAGRHCRAVRSPARAGLLQRRLRGDRRGRPAGRGWLGGRVVRGQSTGL